MRHRASTKGAPCAILLAMSSQAIKNYQWIATNPEILGGKPIVRGTRLAVSFILECLAQDMDANEIQNTYGPFPHESIPEILQFAAELPPQQPMP